MLATWTVDCRRVPHTRTLIECAKIIQPKTKNVKFNDILLKYEYMSWKCKLDLPSSLMAADDFQNSRQSYSPNICLLDPPYTMGLDSRPGPFTRTTVVRSVRVEGS